MDMAGVLQYVRAMDLKLSVNTTQADKDKIIFNLGGVNIIFIMGYRCMVSDTAAKEFINLMPKDKRQFTSSNDIYE